MAGRTFLVLAAALALLALPQASAQFGERADQRSVEVTVGDGGDVRVKHVVAPSGTPRELELLAGDVSGLAVSGPDGRERTAPVIGDGGALLLLPSRSESVIEYGLSGALEMRDGYWTWDFLYLESTTFRLPGGLDWVYLNDSIVDLRDQRGFVCHGCQMVLEYSYDEQRTVHGASWEGREFAVETVSLSDIGGFAFDQPARSISFDVADGGRFVSATVPLELLWEPYSAFLDGERMLLRTAGANSTHVWLNMRPDAPGEITIIGTTVVPEFSVMAPLAAGLLAAAALPLAARLTPR